MEKISLMKSKKYATYAKKSFVLNDFRQYEKVRDHCHFAGKFRGVDHSICNLRYTLPKKLPLVFHNGSTYD